MITALIFLFVGVLSLALLWLLFGKRPQQDPVQGALEIQRLLPVHCRHFPQIQHALNASDQTFVERRLPAEIARQWRAERREVIQLYFQGLRQDFLGLEKLARLLAALSPAVKRRQEWEWLRLGIQFRILYRMTQVRLVIYTMPTAELIRLTEMLTALKFILESTMNQMTEALPKIPSTVAS